MIIQRYSGNRRYSLFFLLFISVTISGCSLSGSSDEPVVERQGAMKVSVLSNGQPLKNFEQELIHRVELDGPGVVRLEEFAAREKIVTPKRDARGGLMGLKVRVGLPPEILKSLGVAGGDVVTAFGVRRAKTESSLGEFVNALHKSPESSLTFERQGVPHKVLITVKGPIPARAARKESKASLKRPSSGAESGHNEEY